MEYLDGETLYDRMQREKAMPEIDVIRIGRQIATALAAAHAKHIVHRDLKPENIFIVPDAEAPNGERSKILDFGIAKLALDSDNNAIKTNLNIVMGTPVYRNSAVAAA
jgi:serine/threonine-protein kinase